MRKKIFVLLVLICFINVFAQSYWSAVANSGGTEKLRNLHYYRLDISQFNKKISSAQNYLSKNAQGIEVYLPSASGEMEKFLVYSFPVMDEALAKEYALGSYIGINVNHPEVTVRFSLAPNDFQSMVMSNGKYEFIEPQSTDKKIYAVFEKSNKKPFDCRTGESKALKNGLKSLVQNVDKLKNTFAYKILSNDKKYRTLRLALSVTGEYTQYFGGTVADALTAMNASMTRVNGIMEKDLAVHLNIINNTAIIYTNPATDPYSDASVGVDGAWNVELMNTLHNAAICGDAHFDIGHLFGASGGGGNAGCIGCVCSNDTTVDSSGFPTNYKGSAYTSPANRIPSGDNFDIDYVVHEIGHQLGANHTFSYVVEGTGVNVEPASGSTIMGYAGITNADVQAHSDAYFHTVSIDQIQTNLASTTCDVETATTNTPPSIAPLSSYTIPKSTAFVLTASVTDAESNPMTYTWEEVDDAGSNSVTVPTGNNFTGPLFRSLSPTKIPTRYFPKLSTVLGGSLINATDWESVSNVARSTNFKITVRDNNPAVTQQQTNSASQSITVGDDGPFVVLTKNNFYNNVNTPINWSVANTVASPYNVANVKIDYTADSGTTWTILSASTVNDGTESFNLTGITVPIIVRVSAVGNVFYAVSNTLVSTAATSCSITAPTNVAIYGTTCSSANITWDLMSGATYIVRYKKTSDTTWTQISTTKNVIGLTGLIELMQYDVQVAAVCSGTIGSFSATANFTTLEKLINVCGAMSYDSSSEYISNVTVDKMSHNSNATSYSDFTNTPSALINLTQGSTYTISVTKAWQSTKYSEAVSAWIDWNRDGAFDSSERVMNSGLSATTSVTATFIVPTSATMGVPLRMRVVLSDAAITSPCGLYNYGETEDYKVIVAKSTTDGSSTQNNSIALYPNPSSDTITISNVTANSYFKIYTIEGRLIKSGNLDGNSVDISKLAKSAYLISIVDESGTHNIKFLKK